MMADYREAGIEQADRNIPGRVRPAELVDQAHVAKGIAALRPPEPHRIAAQHHAGTEAHGQHHGTVHLEGSELLDCTPDGEFAADPLAIPDRKSTRLNSSQVRIS